MANEKGKKPRWRVRSWAKSGATKRETARLLEMRLNNMDRLGYDVRDIDYRGKILVGYAREEMPVEAAVEPPVEPPVQQAPAPSAPPTPTLPLPTPTWLVAGSVLESLLGKLRQQAEDAPPVAHQHGMAVATEEESLRPKGKVTNHYLSALLQLADMNMDSVSCKKYIENAIKQIYRGAPSAELELSISDVESWKKKHSEKNGCTDCPIQKTLQMGIEGLQAKLQASPPN